jgi:hypothetical protein
VKKKSYEATVWLGFGITQDVTVQVDGRAEAAEMIRHQYGENSILSGPTEVGEARD